MSTVEKEQKGLTRRDFVKATVAGGVAGAVLGAAAGAGAGVALAPPRPEGEPAIPVIAEKELTCDVLVVGGGTAGYPAALVAAKAGKKVIMIEKKSKTGGEGELSGGGVSAAGTDYQKAAGIVDSPQLWFEEQRKWDPRGNPELQRALAENSAPLVHFLRDLGMKWTTPSPTASPDMGCSVGRSHGSAEQGTGVYKVMASAFEATGGKPLTETIGVKLLTDTKGVVLGVIAKDKEGYFKIKAKVTILTCGGIQGNVEMMTKYVGPDSVYALQRGLLTNTGDGILMGMEVRAATKAMERVHGYVHIPPYPMPYPLDLYGAWLANGGEKLGRFMTCLNTTILMSNFAYCIVVNIRGERFADESRPRLGEQMCNAILRQPEVRAYVIADQPLYDKYLKTITENAANGLKALGYGPPQYATADKIEDLAIKVGINPSVLSSTVSEYNKAVAEGTTAFLKIPKTNKDPLGLYEKLKMNFLYKIETPPFYAVMVTSGVSHGHGGLDINGNCQVLDRENKVIPGLYAAGDNAVLYQGNYSGGYGQGLIQGYIAGKHAVASLK